MRKCKIMQMTKRKYNSLLTLSELSALTLRGRRLHACVLLHRGNREGRHDATNATAGRPAVGGHTGRGRRTTLGAKTVAIVVGRRAAAAERTVCPTGGHFFRLPCSETASSQHNTEKAEEFVCCWQTSVCVCVLAVAMAFG